MRSSPKTLFVAACGGLLALTSVAVAHVSVRGPGLANTRQVLTFFVGHGCEGADTYRVEVQIPAEITSLRAMPSSFGEPELVVNGDGVVTRVAWEKPTARNADDSFYEMKIRVAIPDMAFGTLYFPATQYCRTAGGEERVTEWRALPGEEGEHAPSLQILPQRRPGWNKYTSASAITDLSVFDDAQIVWVGEAAYSASADITAMIQAEPDVDDLTQIGAGAEIWVKY